MNIPSKDHVTNEVICRQAAIGEYEEILALLVKKKL